MAVERQVMFIDAEGKAWALGENDFGELGLGPGTRDGLSSITRARQVVLPLAPGVVVVDIKGGKDHTLFLTSDGAVYAAGNEENGALGAGQARFSTFQETPVRTLIGPANARVIALGAGQWHSLAILSDGSVVGWGFNSPGLLGDGTQTSRSTPVSSSGLNLE
jgi:alpha-tubulin suppressor-like RCC1 family protein